MNALKRFSKWYISFADSFKYLILLLAIGVGYLAVDYAFFSGNLKINSDLSVLLPDSTPSVKALKESNARFGATDKFMIAIQAKSPQLVADLQDSIQADMRKQWGDILISSQTQRDNTFFKDKALLYLPVHHLERVRDNLVQLQQEMGTQGPLVVDLLSDLDQTAGKPKPKKELVWFDADIPQELGLPDEAAEAFTAFFEEDQKATNVEKKEAFNPKGILPPHLKNRLIGQHETEKTINGIIVAKLTEPSTNLNFTEDILNRSEKLLSKYRKQYAQEDVYFSVEGTYEGLKDVDDMKKDSQTSLFVSVGLILLLLFFFFRSFKAPILLVVQVGYACILMMAFTAWIYGQLNPFTLFVAAIILGMGIDFSIHMIGTAQRYLYEFKDLKRALEETLVHLIKPMVLAGVTTIGGLLALLVADFKGFYEFGVIASAGILFSVVIAILGLPVLILAVGGLPAMQPVSFFPKSWDDARIFAFLKRSIRVVAVLSLVSLILLPFAEFEHDFRNLRSVKKKSSTTSDQPRMRTGVAESSKRKSSQPVAILGDNPAELDKLYDTLMVRLHSEKDPYLRSFLTLKSFVPPEDLQEERLEIIEEIRDLINARVFDKADSDKKEMVASLRKMAIVEDVFEPNEIPEWALNLLKEKDGSYGKIGFVYGSYQSWNALDVGKFQDNYSQWNFGGKDLRAFSSSFIFSDVIRAVKNDSVKMAVFISLILVLILTLSLRKPKLIGISVIALAMGALWTMGLMGLVNLGLDLGKIGIYNVIVIPTLLGVGIDATIHLLVSYLDQPSKDLKRLYDTTGRLVLASSLTTAAGFVGVLFIQHRGMRTIGELAVIGIAASLLAALIITPYLSKKWLDK